MVVFIEISVFLLFCFFYFALNKLFSKINYFRNNLLVSYISRELFYEIEILFESANFFFCRNPIFYIIFCFIFLIAICVGVFFFGHFQFCLRAFLLNIFVFDSLLNAFQPSLYQFLNLSIEQQQSRSIKNIKKKKKNFIDGNMARELIRAVKNVFVIFASG